LNLCFSFSFSALRLQSYSEYIDVGQFLTQKRNYANAIVCIQRFQGNGIWLKAVFRARAYYIKALQESICTDKGARRTSSANVCALFCQLDLGHAEAAQLYFCNFVA
jgi:hypothetical protein